MAALERSGWQVTIERPSERGTAAVSAIRSMWRRRGLVRRAAVVHVEFGSNDRAAFWAACFAVLARRDCTVVAHDHPRFVHSPAAGLLPLSTRLQSVVAYRLLVPLLDRPIKRLVLGRAGSIVVLGEQARRDWGALTSAPIIVVSHGPEEPIHGGPPPSQGRHVLFAGVIGPAKGVDLLLDAWSAVAGETELPLVIAGAPGTGYTDWARELRTRPWPGAPAPLWIGRVEDERRFQQLFAEAAIVVLPYRASSPASGILVRAMVQGRCVVASRVPAVVGAIRDGSEGLLFEPGDRGGLTGQLRAVLRDPSRRDALGAAAAARAAERFAWEPLVAGLERAYAAGHRERR